MKQPHRLKKLLAAPLIYLGALVLLVEEWFWDLGTRLVNFVAGWPLLKAIEDRVRALPPYGALCVFVLPGVLLFPVKVLALLAIASGHALSGVTVIVAAKIGGAAVVARLYALTRPALLSLPWFARWHNAFIALKDRWIGRLKQTLAFRRISMLSARMRTAARALLGRLRPRKQFGMRRSVRPARILRRFLAIWRARRRG